MTAPFVARFYPCAAALRTGILLLLTTLLILSCSGPSRKGDPPRGVYHLVKSGQTLSAIARAYRVSVRELAEINSIDAADRIEAGSVLFIPGANQVLDDILTVARPPEEARPTSAVSDPAAEAPPAKPAVAAKAPPKKETETRERKRKEREKAEAAAKDRAAPPRAADRDMASRGGAEGALQKKEAEATIAKTPEDSGVSRGQTERKLFLWPVKGKVVTKFGMESVMADYSGRQVVTTTRMHNGIRIAAAAGAPVTAAAAGEVSRSMILKQFGNTIIIDHDGDYKTVYYELGKRLVEQGQKVKRGDPIAFMAESTASNGESVMNFEVRHKNKPRDPLSFLP